MHLTHLTFLLFSLIAIDASPVPKSAVVKASRDAADIAAFYAAALEKRKTPVNCTVRLIEVPEILVGPGLPISDDSGSEAIVETVVRTFLSRLFARPSEYF